MLLSELARDRGIRYFLIAFTDLFGVQRAKLIPAQSIDLMAENGVGFVGFSAWLDMPPAAPDILAIPDTNCLFQLPWKKEIAWMPADLYGVDGEPIFQTPRLILKRVLKTAQEKGYLVMTGVECEYFLLKQDTPEILDNCDRLRKPSYEQQGLMRLYDVVSEICDGMLFLGWKPEQNTQKDAIGKLAMNWANGDALITADRQTFFKYMVKSIAENYGFRATFMPKPFANLTGNACNVNLSLWDYVSKTNLFKEADEDRELSLLADKFIGGILASAPALSAFSNPTVNSYKQISSPLISTGETWASNIISYSGNNFNSLIRIPDCDRFELRLADSAANPYLLSAAIIAAGLDGIEGQITPGDRTENSDYIPTLPYNIGKQLPTNLLDALRNLSSSQVLKTALGESFVASYLKLKYQQWHEYSLSITPWELDNTLDC